MAKKNESKSRRNSAAAPATLAVLKTCKLYIGGQFPRTESGRFYCPLQAGKPLANVCLASRKDLRNAIVAARSSQSSWAGRSAFNRSQILYRIAEMLEGRREQVVRELVDQGLVDGAAQTEVQMSIDRLLHYCGWCDKYQQIFSSVNPVASSHFNFSMLEPTGVVVIVASEESPLLGLVSLIAPIIAGGNSCVVLASESRPLSAITFSEVLATSDLPGGVVNILTGSLNELVEHFARHMDVNAIAFNRREPEILNRINEYAASNVKRVKAFDRDWTTAHSQSPYLINDFCECKTTWHPIEKITATGVGY